MKIVFLEVCAKSETAIDAHVRNCRILCDRLKKNGHKVFLLFIDTIQYFKDTDCDVIIVSYASFYANFAEMDRIISENPKAKIFWLTNEYDIGPNSFLNKQAKIRPVDVIANYEKKIFSNARNQHCLNLNLLFLRDLERREKKYDICYYGTYRKDRAEYFRKYLNSSDIILSSSSKNFKKFQSIGCKFRPCEKFKWGGLKKPLDCSDTRFTLRINLLTRTSIT